MQLWLKNIGASDDRINKRWYDEGSDEGEFRWHVRFSERFAGKNIAARDLLLYHAFVDDLPEVASSASRVSAATRRSGSLEAATTDGPGGGASRPS